jgi:hypothetical protein
MNEFLYVFGFENPADREVNNRLGTDYESSNLIKIIAESETQAKEWGDEVAEKFVNFLFSREGLNDTCWKTDSYSSWIEKNPDEHILQNWKRILTVKIGEYPDFDDFEGVTFEP